MMAAYTGLFHVYRSLISVVEEPVLNCVVVALLFGKVNLLDSTVEPSPVSQPCLPALSPSPPSQPSLPALPPSPVSQHHVATSSRVVTHGIESTHRIQSKMPEMNPTAPRLLIQLLI